MCVRVCDLLAFLEGGVLVPAGDQATVAADGILEVLPLGELVAVQLLRVGDLLLGRNEALGDLCPKRKRIWGGVGGFQRDGKVDAYRAKMTENAPPPPPPPSTEG